MKRERFKKAHEIARNTKHIAGSYSIAFKCALTDLYAEEKSQKIEKKLIELGMKVWSKAGHKRIYVNEWNLKDVFDIEIRKYNTGNLCCVTIGGSGVSNNKAYKILGTDTYYDCLKKEWKGHNGLIQYVKI